MKKIVLAKIGTGFKLSDEAKAWLLERNFGAEYRAKIKRPNCAKTDAEWDEFTSWDLFYEVQYGLSVDLRTDSLLVECVETLGERAGKRLVIKKYDNEKYIPVIHRCDEYDDSEFLMLEPFVSEAKINKCRNKKAIIQYIKSLGIRVEEN